MTQLLVGLGVLAVVAVVFAGFRVGHRRPVARGPSTVLGLLCLTGLVLVNTSDWPLGILSAFWRDHAIIATTVSTVLSVGVGLLAYRTQDAFKQEELDRNIAATGRSGLVDHLVDVDVALAMARGSRTWLDRWPGWDGNDRPLRWLRNDRWRLETSAGMLKTADPRSGPFSEPIDAGTWRRELVDQSVRRVMGGMRDWSPLLTRSRAGQENLVELGKLRLELLGVQAILESAEPQMAIVPIKRCQAVCRQMALEFEESSSSDRAHPGRRPELTHPNTEVS